MQAGDDHGGGGGVSPESIRAGHEPDAYSVRPIFSIPVAVVISFVIAFSVGAGVFAYVMVVPKDPMTNPKAAAAGTAPLNDRLARIEEKGWTPNPNPKVDAPRLDQAPRLENNGKTFTQQPLTGPNAGNSPQLHAENLWPDRVAGLSEVGWMEKGKVARIPVDDMIRQLADPKFRDTVLPSRKDSIGPRPSGQMPSAANAGRSNPPAPAQTYDHDDTSHDHPKGGHP